MTPSDQFQNPIEHLRKRHNPYLTNTFSWLSTGTPIKGLGVYTSCMDTYTPAPTPALNHFTDMERHILIRCLKFVHCKPH